MVEWRRWQEEEDNDGDITSLDHSGTRPRFVADSSAGGGSVVFVEISRSDSRCVGYLYLPTTMPPQQEA